MTTTVKKYLIKDDINCTIIFTLSDPQDCSIGQLKWPLKESDRMKRGGGTYFLPDKVSCKGRLVSVHTYFFYNDEGNSSNSGFWLRVGVFRRKGDNYLLRKWINIFVKRHNKTKTWGRESKYLKVPMPVLEGDRIAVRVKKKCANVCPLEPNLKAPGSSSVFFTQSNVDTIPVRQVMASESQTNVFLDVRVSIGKLNWQWSK